MALISCPECGKDVSDKASACIHCGYPLEKETKQTEVPTLEKVEDAILMMFPDEQICLSPKQIENRLPNTMLTNYKIEKILSDMASKNKLRLIFDGTIRYSLPFASNNLSVESEDVVSCPRCGSTQIQLVPRKWSIMTGVLTNKVDRVCVGCKHKF